VGTLEEPGRVDTGDGLAPPTPSDNGNNTCGQTDMVTSWCRLYVSSYVCADGTIQLVDYQQSNGRDTHRLADLYAVDALRYIEAPAIRMIRYHA
jgi:hypothetical protein